MRTNNSCRNANGGGGFWDDNVSTQQEQQHQQHQQQQPRQASSNKRGNKKKGKEEEKVAAMFKAGPPQNEFDAWCARAASKFEGGDVDIPTFLAFLREVDSPNEVN